MPKDEANRILRRVGIVLIIMGCLDIGSMIYAIAHGKSYSSSFNIFAVIAGIFLMRGSLRAASIVRRFVAFFLGAFTGVIFAVPVALPFDLVRTEIRVSPGTFGLDLVLGLALFALLFWVFRQLGQESVRSCMETEGIKHRRIPVILAGGLLIPVGILLTMHFLSGGEHARHAEQLAAQQVGAGFKFYVTSINIFSDSTGTRVRATVTAWNHDQVREIQVGWVED